MYTWAVDVFERLRRCTGFDWDDGNRDKNWLLHRVTAGECEQIFFRQPLVVAADDAHAQDEERFFVLGRTIRHRLLFVVFTLRGSLVRVISARDMTKREREAYRAHG